MSAKSTAAKSTKVLTPSDNPTRFNEVLATIGRTQKVMILCGETVTLAEGLVPLSAPMSGQRGGGFPNTLRRLLFECSPATVVPEQLPADRLTALNLAMTARRIAAREARLTKFHQLLARLFEQGRLVKCLTQSFDGVEERCHQDFSSCLVMLYGDNRVLRCCMPRCRASTDDEVVQLDASFLGGETVLCKECCRINTKTARERRKGTDATRSLRPAVQCNLGAEMLIGKERKDMKEAAGTCQLLLIIGTPLKDSDILDLTRELGEMVRSNYGGVVYVNPQALRGGQSTYDHIDFHLQVEPTIAVDGILSALDQVNDVSMVVDGEDHTADMWFDIINNDIPRATCPEEEEFSLPCCTYCSCAIPDFLISCTQCHEQFCYRRADHLVELNAGLAETVNDSTGLSKGNSTNSGGSVQDNAEGAGAFTFDTACLVFDRYMHEGPQRTLESIKADFVCPMCWEYASAGIYPHFVRTTPRLTIEEHGKPLPRMVLLVYYLEQFWPTAKQLCTLVGGRWKNNGWPCHIEPIKLETLSEQKDVLTDLSWEPKSFDVIVVYLTHGLSGDQGFQVGHKLSYRGDQFLDQTLNICQGLLNKALTKRAFLLCCGHPLLCPPMVRDLQIWVNRPGTLDSIVGCLNRRLSSGFMLSMISRLSTRLVEHNEWSWETMFETWLTDSIARTHSDLLSLAPNRPAEMWLYAPFQSRPLGKPLPDLLQVCNCSKLAERSTNFSTSTMPRKQWKVTHEGKAGRPIKDIAVKAACSRCKQSWDLPSGHLVGDLKNMGGQYGVRVPYFVSENS